MDPNPPEPPPLRPYPEPSSAPWHPVPPPFDEGPEPPPLAGEGATWYPSGPRRQRAGIRDAELREPRRRRWPIVLVIFVTVALALLGVLGGVARATADASSQAAQLSQQGQFGKAIALNYKIASLGGPLFFLDHSDPADAPLNAQRTMLAWGDALAKSGKVDQAVALIGSVTDPSLQAEASHRRAGVLLTAAQSAAMHNDYVTAVQRLQQLLRSDAGSPEASQAKTKLPEYQVGEAQALVAGGSGADAVALLDEVFNEQSTVAQMRATAAYPSALLAAGQQELAAFSYKEAVTTMKRLVDNFGGSPEAGQARDLMSARQPVTGTLVDKNGRALSGRVRLSSHYTSVPGGYLTSGPFYYTDADADGNFTFANVQVGGPYTLEEFHNGGWTTLIDPGSGQPAGPVTVSPLEPTVLTFIVLPT